VLSKNAVKFINWKIEIAMRNAQCAMRNAQFTAHRVVSARLTPCQCFLIKRQSLSAQDWKTPTDPAVHPSHDLQKILRQHGFKVSLSGKGNCHDCEYGEHPKAWGN